MINQKGNCVVLSLAASKNKIENENLQALFINLVQKRIVNQATEVYENQQAEDQDVNALIVLDEAHRFASPKPVDAKMKDVCQEIVDVVKTTRKYGVG